MKNLMTKLRRLRFCVRRTLPVHKCPWAIISLGRDHYLFHDGDWLKHWWFGPVWVTFSSFAHRCPDAL